MKIQTTTPFVEIDGDEMAHVMWQKIKEEIIIPNINLNIQYFDLSIENRIKTDDQITFEAAKSLLQYGIGAKCATITPNKNKQKELELNTTYNSPNATIRNLINGTIFREPITFKNIKPVIQNWKLPISIARHGFGDQYNAYEFVATKCSKIEISCAMQGNQNFKIIEHDVVGDSVFMLMHNNKQSISNFATSCLQYALEKKINLFLSTKNTISKIYDEMFVEAFDKIFNEQFKGKFEEHKIQYSHKLIDDMVAFAIKSSGGFLWACKNYDGDVQSDFIAQSFGGISIMKSTIIGNNVKLSEAAHGTVPKHFEIYKRGEETYTNPIGSILAWADAIKNLGEKESNIAIINFAKKLEIACKKTVENGIFTKDLATHNKSTQFVSTNVFIAKIKETLLELI